MSVWLLRKFNARIEILVSFPLVQYIVRIKFPNSIYFLLLLYYYFTDMCNFSLYIYIYILKKLCSFNELLFVNRKYGYWCFRL